jgi:hypothetical protein
MFTPVGRFFLWNGRTGAERLDQPLSNFDVIGISTRSWSSHFCACYENILPSCIVSFCCPCVMWGQIVIRAQIPMLIGIKNSLPWCRNYTGYGMFVDLFFWSLVIGVVFAAIAFVVSGIPSAIRILLWLIAAALLIGFIFIVGHTRTAFREKLVLFLCSLSSLFY